MSQLTIKELRFSDKAICKWTNSQQRILWNAWYQSDMMADRRPNGAFLIPRKIADVILYAIRSEKQHVQSAINAGVIGNADESDVINDLEVLLHIERELKLEAA